MKPNQGETAKQSWEPMQLSCVGHIGGVVEAAGVKEVEVLRQVATPPAGDPGDTVTAP